MVRCLCAASGAAVIRPSSTSCLQAAGKDVGGDALERRAVQLAVGAAVAEHDVPQDDEAPAVAEHFDRQVDGTARSVHSRRLLPRQLLAVYNQSQRAYTACTLQVVAERYRAKDCSGVVVEMCRLPVRRDGRLVRRSLNGKPELRLGHRRRGRGDHLRGDGRDVRPARLPAADGRRHRLEPRRHLGAP